MAAPGVGSGEEELRRLRTNPAFRPTDQAVRISWDTLAEVVVASIPAEHPEYEFAINGLNTILDLIATAKDVQYPLEGVRDTISQICISVKEQLESEFEPVKLGIWRGQNFFDIYSIKSDMSISIVPSYDPDIIPDLDESGGPILQVKLLIKFKLSAQGSKKQDRKAQWRELTKSQTFGPLGEEFALSGRWYQRELEIEACPELIGQEMLSASRGLIEKIVQYV